MAADGQIEAVLEEIETLDPHFAEAHSEVVFSLIRSGAGSGQPGTAGMPQFLKGGLLIASNR